MPTIKVLFVCLGNICRSPLAEAIFKHKIKEKGLEKFVEADSCGTANYHVDQRPDPRTLANAKKNGISIDHRGRQLKSNDLEHFDFIFAMDGSNHANILQMKNASSHETKIALVRDFDPIEKGEVPDPYHGNELHFQEVFDILNRTLDEFIAHLEKTVLKV
jgi:protein-tyrosine phosphatase